jgi:chromosomal replication initiation ATPase DnaA
MAAVQYQQPKVTNDNLIIIKIKEVIKEVTGVSFDQFNKKTREKEIAFSRQLFQYLCRTFTSKTLTEIGKITSHSYGHWTVLHSKTEIENIIHLKYRAENWPKVESAILRLTAYTGKKIL